MPRLTVDTRKELVKLNKEGISNREIGRRLNCDEKTVRLTLQKYKKTGSVHDSPKCGRPRVTSPMEDRYIKVRSLRNRFETAPVLRKECSLVGKCSISTVKNRLKEFKLRGCIARRKPMVSLKNRKRRMDFAKTHEDKDASFWNKVLFSDECKFNRLGSDGKQYVRRKNGEEFKPMCTVSTLQGGGGSVMVWGIISVHGPGPLARLNGKINSGKYIKMLEDHFMDYFVNLQDKNCIFMQDNAPIHTARNVKKFLQERDVPCLDWPAQSPDINPIENVWHNIKHQLRNEYICNLDELWVKIKEKWDLLDPMYCRKLIQGMPKRLRAVKSQKGYATKY